MQHEEHRHCVMQTQIKKIHNGTKIGVQLAANTLSNRRAIIINQTWYTKANSK